MGGYDQADAALKAAYSSKADRALLVREKKIVIRVLQSSFKAGSEQLAKKAFVPVARKLRDTLLR